MLFHCTSRKERGIVMNKILCALFPMFLLGLLPACDEGSGLEPGHPTGDLVVNNNTSWKVVDVSTGVIEDDGWCIEILPGKSATLKHLYAPTEPKCIAVVFKDSAGTVVRSEYSVVLVPNKVTVLNLEGSPVQGGSGAQGGTP
jgi:hypothetical protein